MITSPHNDKLKEIRRLNRRREARFVAEGEDLLEAADRAGWRPVYRLTAGVDVAPELLADVSALGSGTRALAVYERRFSVPTGPLCVALWGVRDPGNVGTVLRSALAFGAASVALGPDCADPFGPKAVRASMGAIFALPVARVSDPEELPGVRVALAAHAGEPLAGPLDDPLTIIVGAERAGLPADVIAKCDEVAHIPIATESLNAAMAATVALYEATRGRVRPARGGEEGSSSVAPAAGATPDDAPSASSPAGGADPAPGSPPAPGADPATGPRPLAAATCAAAPPPPADGAAPATGPPPHVARPCARPSARPAAGAQTVRVRPS